MISGFDKAGWGNIPAEISYYLATASNDAGEFGIRRDNWGATESWYNEGIWENNTVSYSGVQLKDLIMNKWKTAPITGEPCCNSGYASLPSQVKKYHVTSFGNGNYGTAVTGSNVITASKLAGARIILTQGNITTANDELNVTLNWQNTGVAPVYKNWIISYELKNSLDTTVWTDNSGFSLKLFLPRPGSTAHTDKFILPKTLPPGPYKLNLIIRDPVGYRPPFPLGIAGRNADGSYTLTTVTLPSPSTPQKPGN